MTPTEDDGIALTTPSLSAAEFSDIFAPVETGRASGIIVRQARSAILAGRLRVGQRLPAERELAEQLGVSRVTVRDAMRVLEANGLIRIRPGAKGGAFVSVPSVSLLRDGLAHLLVLSDVEAPHVTEVRHVLETNAVRFACQRATQEDIRELYEICDQTEDAIGRGDYDIRLSAKFHARLAASSQNPAFALVVESLYGPMLISLAEAKEVVGDFGVGDDRYEHRQIVDAIQAGDEATAVAVLERHLGRTAARLEERLDSIRG